MNKKLLLVAATFLSLTAAAQNRIGEAMHALLNDPQVAETKQQDLASISVTTDGTKTDTTSIVERYRITLPLSSIQKIDDLADVFRAADELRYELKDVKAGDVDAALHASLQIPYMGGAIQPFADANENVIMALVRDKVNDVRRYAYAMQWKPLDDDVHATLSLVYGDDPKKQPISNLVSYMMTSNGDSATVNIHGDKAQTRVFVTKAGAKADSIMTSVLSSTTMSDLANPSTWNSTIDLSKLDDLKALKVDISKLTELKELKELQDVIVVNSSPAFLRRYNNLREYFLASKGKKDATTRQITALTRMYELCKEHAGVLNKDERETCRKGLFGMKQIGPLDAYVVDLIGLIDKALR